MSASELVILRAEKKLLQLRVDRAEVCIGSNPTNDVVLPDPEVSSDKNVYPLLLSSYRRGIPVIGFSKAYVHAGALAAVYSTPQQLGQQTATMIIHFLQSNPRHFPPPQPPVDFQISVNPSVARSLGLTMPDEQALYQHVRAFEAVSR